MTEALGIWPVLVSLLGLAVAWGAALTKIADLRRRVDVLERQVTAEIRADIGAIREDIRELMTLVKRKTGTD
jgi:hypothetical protein